MCVLPIDCFPGPGGTRSTHSIAADGEHVESLGWYNNSKNQDYRVELQYQYCLRTEADFECEDDPRWSEQQRLDSMRLRLDKHNDDCEGDAFDYRASRHRGCVRVD